MTSILAEGVVRSLRYGTRADESAQNSRGRLAQGSSGALPHQGDGTVPLSCGWPPRHSTRRARVITLFEHRGPPQSPHIVFNLERHRGYFPGPFTGSAGRLPDPRPHRPTRASCATAIPAMAAWHIWEVARIVSSTTRGAGGFLEGSIQAFAWHQYLATTRDPEESVWLPSTTPV